MRKKLKISARLSIGYTIMTTAIILTVIVFFYTTYVTRIRWESEDNLKQITKSVMDQVDHNLDAVDQVTIDVMIAPDFRTAWERYLLSDSGEEEGNALRRILINTYRTRSNIRRVAVYDLEGNYVCTSTALRSKEEVKTRGRQILEKYKLNEATSRVYLGSAVDFWNESRNIQVITEVKPIKNSQTEITGFIEVQQNVRYMEEACRTKINGQDVPVTILLNDPVEILFSNIDSEPVPDIEGVEQYANRYSRIHTLGEYIVSITPSNTYYCDAIAMVPRDVFYASANSMMRSIILFGVIMILANIIFSQVMTKRILRPLTELVRYMEKTDITNIGEKNRFQANSPETEIVYRSFEDMTDRLRQSLEKQKKMEAVQTQVIFDALQTTIGPHFLYNSLGGIANMCEEGENKEAADACYSLTEILRYSAGYVETEAAIGDEIENIRAYLSIMKSRYRERLEYEIFMEEGCRYLMVPKLTFQPLVENAIKYSLMEHETVIVHVSVTEENGHVSVEIADNGSGISAEQEEKIHEEMAAFLKDKTKLYEPEKIQFGGMGLAGTLIRLSLFFENNFWYRIDSKNKEGGTSICFGFDR